MNFWIYFWITFLFISLLLYAGVAVIVTINGFRDMRQLFKELNEQHKLPE